MGNSNSTPREEQTEDPWWNNTRRIRLEETAKINSVDSEETEDIWWSNGKTPKNEETSTQNEENGLNRLSEEHKEKLNEFKLEFARKHEKRREILAAKRKEMQDLRDQVLALTKENKQLKKLSNGELNLIEEMQRLEQENETLRTELKEKNADLERVESLSSKNNELRISIAEMQKELQELNTEILDFEKERQDYQAHVVALKDVVTVSKQMLNIRETQLRELKQKVESIESSLAGREINILSQDLRNEYERQLQNIRNLRTLYEERQQAGRREKQELLMKLEESKIELKQEIIKNQELEERVNQLEEDNSKKYDEIMSLESNLGLSKAESRQYQAELTVVNKLFSEILLGVGSNQGIDLDKLTQNLEDHHGLLQNIVINEISPTVSAALPKVLLDLVSQVSGKEHQKEIQEGNNEECGKKLDTIVEESESQTSTVHQMNSAEEIVELLPKVWKVLIELLSQQKAPINVLTDEQNDENPCYKTVDTPKGPSLVLSVSQTFIRLKDLILEKKSLEKETNHLKQLNTHLDTRLQDQEKRLEMVCSELAKTWHVVGKLQKQHQLLHTQEKILRYELAQKRKLLATLKEELEYSREKCQQAKEKNTLSEKQWKQMRTEFTLRRNTHINDDFNNSTESGYSDERCSSSDDEPGYETDISEINQKPDGDDGEETPSDLEQASSASAIATQGLPDDTDYTTVTEEEMHDTLDLEEQVGVRDGGNNAPALNGTGITLDSIDNSSNSVDDHFINKETVETEENDETTNDNQPGTSAIQNLPKETSEMGETSGAKPKMTFDEMIAAKEERLKRLEGQCQQLVEKVTKTTTKSNIISSKLDDLHGVYGETSSSSRQQNDITDETPTKSDEDSEKNDQE